MSVASEGRRNGISNPRGVRTTLRLLLTMTGLDATYASPPRLYGRGYKRARLSLI